MLTLIGVLVLLFATDVRLVCLDDLALAIQRRFGLGLAQV
jgi:hypothetical protein